MLLGKKIILNSNIYFYIESYWVNYHNHSTPLHNSVWLFRKRPNNFSIIKVLYYICPWYNVFKLFNHKNLFWSIWSITCKNIVIILYSHTITNFRSLSLLSASKSIYVLVLLCSSTISSSLSIYIFSKMNSNIGKGDSLRSY